MKENVKFFGIVVLIMAMIFIMAGCDNGTTAQTGEFTVTFTANGGLPAPAAQSLDSGDKVTEPAAMTKAGFTFDGWYKEAGFDTKWNFATDTIVGNTPLYAKWVPAGEFTVTFVANSGLPAPAAQSLDSGDHVVEPAAMTKAGYTFGGWYKEAGFITKWDFATDTIVGNTILYAKWELVRMVLVPGGSFNMGTAEGGGDGETPNHNVTITTFYMGKYEITQAQYQAVMASNPSYFTTDAAVGETQAARPVEQVSWYDAVEFCNKLSEMEGLDKVYMIVGTNVSVDLTKTGYRLPTEAEWEYAAKGGAGSPEDYEYSGSDTAGDVAWFSDNSNSISHEVGKKTANALDLYDMSGNVYEWCGDWYDGYLSDPQTDPQGPASGTYRVSRGGSSSDAAALQRSASRETYMTPESERNWLGFRIVRR